ncbi:MAG: glycerol kinase GlpK [Alphaproteobacteria bacterium]|nr:glycerol kinase GlpK [Alphaproteobacteria bacterium]
MSTDLILAIDQGTTSSRAILFTAAGVPVASAQQEFPQHYPKDGWVEHDPEDIWSSTIDVCKQALAQTPDGATVHAIGLTNQRETAIIWDRETGEAIHNAIVWQDRRTTETCATLTKKGAEEAVRPKTGLVLDPYFSATKFDFILDAVPGARARAERGELCAGTVDSFLIWRLTDGERHVTDVTNASRTSLFNIHSQDWDAELLRIFRVPREILPDVLDCAADFGAAKAEHLGLDLPILGVAGDQQAAAIGQACFAPGSIKSTYGTGCFAIINTGDSAVLSKNRLLTTIASRIDGKTHYALEGSIFVAGAAIQWLRDGLGVIASAAESQKMAESLDDNGGVYLVPAFVGLGAPYWRPEARGAMFGLTRDSGPAHFARAALESVAYQTVDLFVAMEKDGIAPETVRVDGGMVANDWFAQFLADALGKPVDRPIVTETTALGAAYLAAHQAGLLAGLDGIAEAWRLERRFEPRIDAVARRKLLSGWENAVARTLHKP